MLAFAVFGGPVPDITVANITDFLGSPMPGLTQGMVDASLAAVRRWCRWHVTPHRSETFTVDVDGRLARLPSLRVTDVVSVVDADSGMFSGVSWSEVGVLTLPAIPQGFRALTVEVEHGWPLGEVPDVLAVVASIARRFAAGGLAAAAGQLGPVVREQIGAYQYGMSDAFASALGTTQLLDGEREMLANYRISTIE